MSRPREQWIVLNNKSTMTEDIKKFKNLRRTKLASFTRKQNQLQSFIDGTADANKLREVYAELRETYNAVENAHESYVSIVEESVLDEEGDYMEVPSNALHTMDVKVTEKISRLNVEENSAADRKNIEEKKNKFKQSIEAFGSPSRLITQLSTGKTVSFADMRLELSKVETTYENLAKERVVESKQH